ncbi:FAD-dependent oxidoreductase [Falsibacillus pallidus]|uniref:Glycine/D-amino acid oxidase-like deaminating enzyme n=1 Tax=Falsibacillus pallidus TaxID=493781 RepID=A0A370GG75_9BACI|nr:FAD-dependent oxidoreductase [Falsibacillus pallidus]RDI42320.1 glycine/D-amino acid oxidase-like deaminating enzyme [Falsibacillus pallidus]
MSDSLRENTPPEPIWRKDVLLPSFPALAENLSCDVVVAGGGITGITTACLLAKEGLSVILVEADQLLNGTTGHTTAKVTIQHDLIYDELIQHFGLEKTKQYYAANQSALDFIKNTIAAANLDCGYVEQDAYLYATTKSSADKLKKEYEAYQKIGIPGEILDNIPLELNVEAALKVPKQVQFHPIKYLQHLVDSFLEAGGKIFEQTTAKEIQKDTKIKVVMRSGHSIECSHLAACTHFPFIDEKGFYFTRMHADRSYVITAACKKEFPGGMYLSVDEPKRSIRSVECDGQHLLMIGGESHKAGQSKENEEKHYQALAEFAEDVFDAAGIHSKWSAQDLITLDKVPYIGPITSSKPSILIATGYRKWGMTNGTYAAHLLKDYVLGKSNPYSEVFNPSRFKADPSVKHFIKENANVAAELIKGKLSFPGNSLDDLQKDEGAIVMYNDDRTGAYRDLEGNLHLVDVTCTHLGCECEWNSGDKTWDCPCHGSRFTYDGDVVEGPAKKPLKIIEPY